jgi:hypothetical protein
MQELQSILDDFVFSDCRLGSHPEILAAVYIKHGDCYVCRAATGSSKEVLLGTSIKCRMAGNGMLILDGPVLGSEIGEEHGEVEEIFVPLTHARPDGVLVLRSAQAHLYAAKSDARLLAALLECSHRANLWGTKKFKPYKRNLLTELRAWREQHGIWFGETIEESVQANQRLDLESNVQALYRWALDLGILLTPSPTIAKLVEVTPQVIDLLRADPEELHRLTASEFEIFVAERLASAGFEVQLTGRTNLRDGGIDIVAVPKDIAIVPYVLAAQLKHSRNFKKVGRESVDRLLSWRNSLFNAALLVTNTGFTRDALWVASRDVNRGFIRLRDYQDLRRWIQDNFWSPSEWREIPTEVELCPGIRISIPKPQISEVVSRAIGDLTHNPSAAPDANRILRGRRR